jgi:hypothetical protein
MRCRTSGISTSPPNRAINFAILTAARTKIAGEPNHGVRPVASVGVGVIISVARNKFFRVVGETSRRG